MLSNVLLLSDIDNTLLPRNGTIGQKDLAAIEKFKTLGGYFAFCTGRSAVSAELAVKLTGLCNCPAVIYNGGGIFDYESRTLVDASSLSAAARCKVFEIVKKFPEIGAIPHIDCKIHCINEGPYTEGYILHENDEYHVTSPSDLPLGNWNKAVFLGRVEQIEELIAYTETLDLENEDYYFLRSDRYLLEILPKDATKGNGIRRLANYLKVDMQDTYAIGDYYNDIELLKTAAVSAAVGNAPEEVKQQADIVTCGCSEGGVAEFIEYIIAARQKAEGNF